MVRGGMDALDGFVANSQIFVKSSYLLEKKHWIKA
jgi:hypothetical protein